MKATYSSSIEERLNWISPLTCRNSTAEDTNFVKRSSRIDLGKTANMNHSVLTKGWGTNKVVNGLPSNWKSRLSITQHHTSVSVDPKKITHITLLWFAMSAFLTLSCEDRKHMVTGFQFCHPLTNTFDNPTRKENIKLVSPIPHYQHKISLSK